MGRKKAQLSKNMTKKSPTRNLEAESLGCLKAEENPSAINENKKSRNLLKVALVLGCLILGYLLYRNKNLILAGSVNGTLIYKSEINQILQNRYGKQVLEELINEKLIFQEAQKKNIKITDKDVNTKISELEKNIGGKKQLEELLTTQGLTQEEFKKQITIRLLVDTLLKDKLKVSDKEIDDYILKNADVLEAAKATDSASQKKYAQDFLTQQKMSTEFEKWFNDLKQKAKIQKFL